VATAAAAASPVAAQAAAASPAAATAVAAASPAAATAVAAASPLATQAAAAASPVAAAASPAVATAGAASPVRITGAQLSPTDTTLSVQNTGSTPLDLAGWRLSVGQASATLPSGARIAPGETVTIHTAAGTSSARDIYLGQEAAALMSGLRPGATIALVNGQGQQVGQFTLPG
jgi:hypothetical protein